jgi:hypothetical protein
MGLFGKRGGGLIPTLALSLLLAGSAPGIVRAAAADPFPEINPSTRIDAVKLLGESGGSGSRCLTPTIQMSRGGNPAEGRAAAGRALALLESGVSFAREQRLWKPGGVLYIYTDEPNDFDCIDRTDADSDGTPDIRRATTVGLKEARGLLVETLGLTAPAPIEVLLIELGDDLDGYVVPSPERPIRPRLVLDASPRDGYEGARRAAIHQFAHAVAQAASPSFPHDWAEALATWAVLTIDGAPDLTTGAVLSGRLDRLESGLFSTGADLGAGNAIWLAFLEQAYGISAIRTTIEELGRGLPVASALDRAVRRVSNDDLESAFAEFHLWSVLVGARADGRHFSFAEHLAEPEFAFTARGLPALSVQGDPPLGSFGAAQIRILPDAGPGGLRLHFEGDFAARWEADVILVGDLGTMRRLPLHLSAEGRGETTVPLEGIAEALLLVRNIGGSDDGPHRFTCAAHLEKGFPVEIVALDAAPLEQPDDGVLISWETLAEQELIGFNILRQREDGGRVTVVNPVWIPALGDLSTQTSYHFIDRSAGPGISYSYRIQAITISGLSSHSTPVVVKGAVGPK